MSVPPAVAGGKVDSGMRIVSSKSIVGLRLIGALFVSMFLIACESEPSESDIRLQFTAKRPMLERLVEMSNEDFARTRVTRISPEFTRLEHDWGWPRPASELGLSKERWDEYRKLFAEAEVLSGLERIGGSSDGVMFSVWGFGIADNSFSKGILYSPVKPVSTEGESQRIKYQLIDDGWYYFEWSTW